MTHAFVSYVREDQASVDKLCAELKARGVSVWLDREQIEPGSRWRDAIRCAIRRGSFFIACFSPAHLAKEKSYMNEELTLAIEELRARHTGVTWFIPVLLDGGRVPDRSIGGGETLHHLQWVDLQADWKGGIVRLAKALGAADSARVDLHRYHAAYDVTDFDGRHACVDRVISYEPLNLGTSLAPHRPAEHYELHEKDKVLSTLLRVHRMDAGKWQLLHEEIGALTEDVTRKTCKFESTRELSVAPGSLAGDGQFRVEMIDRLIMNTMDRDILASYGTIRDLRFVCGSRTGEFEFSVGDSPFLVEITKGREWTLKELAPRETIAVRWNPT